MKKNWIGIVVILLIGLMPVASFAAIPGKGNLEDILLNLQRNFPAILNMTMAAAYVIGIYLIAMSIFRLVQYGTRTVFNMAQLSLVGSISYFFIGVVLVFLPVMFQTSVNTLWGSGAANHLLAYPTDTSMRWENIVRPLFDLTRVIGLIAFVKGWTMLAKAGGGQMQPGQKGKAIMHIIGGILALNIVGTLNILNATFFGT